MNDTRQSVSTNYGISSRFLGPLRYHFFLSVETTNVSRGFITIFLPIMIVIIFLYRLSYYLYTAEKLRNRLITRRDKKVLQTRCSKEMLIVSTAEINVDCITYICIAKKVLLLKIISQTRNIILTFHRLDRITISHTTERSVVVILFSFPLSITAYLESS